jgi:hypothetical protein
MASMADLVDFEGQWDLDLLFEMKPAAERIARSKARIEFGILRAAIGSFLDKEGEVVRAFMRETADPEPTPKTDAPAAAPRAKDGKPKQSRDLSGFLSIMSQMGAQVPALRRKPGETKGGAAKPAVPEIAPRRNPRRHHRR